MYIPPRYKRADGSWTGISIELWRRIAEDLGLEYEFRELELELNEFFVQLESREIDAAIAAVSITAERDSRLDFSHG